jgi:hypothetical protein
MGLILGLPVLPAAAAWRLAATVCRMQRPLAAGLR